MDEKRAIIGRKILIAMIIIMVTIIVALNIIFMEMIRRTYYADTENYYQYLIEEETRHIDWITQKMQQMISEVKPFLTELDEHIMQNVFEASLGARERMDHSLATTAQNVSRSNRNTVTFYFRNGHVVEYIEGVRYPWTFEHYERDRFIHFLEGHAIHFFFEQGNEIYAFAMKEENLQERVRQHIIESHTSIVEGDINIWINDLSAEDTNFSIFVDDAQNIILQDEWGTVLFQEHFSKIPEEGFLSSTYSEELDMPRKILGFRKNEEYKIVIVAVSDLTLGKEIQMEKNRSEITMRYTVIIGASLVLLGFMIWVMYRIQLGYIDKMEDFGEEMREIHDNEKKHYENLSEEVNKDVLTGLYSRKYTHHYLSDLPPNILSRMSYVLCDIDHFKRINDSYGHEIGDFVLRDVAKVMTDQNINRSYFVTRWGGEEFLILFHDTKIDETLHICEMIRNAIEEHPFQYADIEIKITMSFGISTLMSEDETVKDMIINADKALYRSKNTGRNRTTVYQKNTTWS